VKKQRLFAFIIGVLLSAGVLLSVVSGCHDPVKGVVMVADSNDNPPGEYAETGGTVEFRSDSKKYPNFEVTVYPNLCTESNPLKGTNIQPVTCHIPKNATLGRYTFTITEQDAQRNASPNPPPPPIPFNVKQCPAPCKW
jgi:hypothetical protein